MIAQGLYVFMLMFALDVVWALYTQAMVASRSILASSYAAAIQLFSAGLVLEYTEHHWLLVPAGMGAFAGTYVVSSGAVRKIGAALRRRSGSCRADRARTGRT